MTQIVDLLHGGRASYDVVGEGYPTLFFAGGPGLPVAAWRGDASLFADSLRFYLIDPPGSGVSPAPTPPARYSPWDHARFYEEVREALGLERVVAFGQSWGANVALVYAAMFPDPVKVCVAGCPFSIGEEVDLPQRAELETEFLRNLGRHAGQPWFERSCEVLTEWHELVLAAEPQEFGPLLADLLPLWMAHPERPTAQAVIAAMCRSGIDAHAQKDWNRGLFQTADIRPYAKKVRCPTLLLAGEMDFLNGPAQVAVAASLIREATVAVIEDCGHLLAFEGAAQYRQAVREFLDRTLAASSAISGETVP
jgi:pimeloyl-ACP methyl ester carboxylesterase